MEEVDKGCLMIRMGVSGYVLLVPAHPGIGPLNGWVCIQPVQEHYNVLKQVCATCIHL